MKLFIEVSEGIGYLVILLHGSCMVPANSIPFHGRTKYVLEPGLLGVTANA